MNCHSCHNTFPQAASFCPFCGASAPRVSSSKTVPGGIQVSDLDVPALQTTASVDSEWEEILGGMQTLRMPAVSTAAANVPESNVDEYETGNTLFGGFKADDIFDGELPTPLRTIEHPTVIIDESLSDTPYNATLLDELAGGANSTAELVALDEFEFGQSWGVKLFITAAVIAALIGGIAAGFSLSEEVAPQAPEPVVEASPSVEESGSETTRQRLRVSVMDEEVQILRGAEVLHTVSTTEGSRYDDLSERGRSVQVRLEHVQKKSDGLFRARPSAERYELVYGGLGDDAFRVLDVTKADAKKLDTTPDLLANLLADRFNEGLPAPNS